MFYKKLSPSDEALSQPSPDPLVVEEYPFATSSFAEEPRPPEIQRDQVVGHTTVGGKGVVGRLLKKG